VNAADASSLAEALDAPLVTFDGNLARAPGNRARIELLRRP
jgi:predicted nucleic acid-binding protein